MHAFCMNRCMLITQMDSFGSCHPPSKDSELEARKALLVDISIPNSYRQA